VNFLDAATPRFEGRYAPPPPATAPREIRVVTFNVKYAREIDRAIEVLRESDSLRNADIIALQEMDDRGTERIARALRLNFAYLPSTINPITDTFFGPAVLTRWAIDSAWRVPLPHASVLRGQRRSATAALIRLGDKRVRLYSVHLETQSSISAEERVEQADAVLRDAADAREPVIVAGDLNSYGIGEHFQQRGLLWLTQSFGETIMFWGWDHLLARGFSRGQVRSVGVERNARGASDHRPVWAVLGLTGNASATGRRSRAQRPAVFTASDWPARRRSRRRKNPTSASP
jgi:endonuclease/exonuclease/phosphatase family metal-dependent hydrolase